MALTEKQEYKVEVIPPYSILQVRRADIILKDGAEVARSYHRHVICPGDPVTAEPSIVVQIAGAVHTEEACKKYHDEVIQPQIDAQKEEAKAKAEAAAEELKSRGPSAGTADIKEQKKR